jgi:hypothetical protein
MGAVATAAPATSEVRLRRASLFRAIGASARRRSERSSDTCQSSVEARSRWISDNGFSFFLEIAYEVS